MSEKWKVPVHKSRVRVSPSSQFREAVFLIKNQGKQFIARKLTAAKEFVSGEE